MCYFCFAKYEYVIFISIFCDNRLNICYFCHSVRQKTFKNVTMGPEKKWCGFLDQLFNK